MAEYTWGNWDYFTLLQLYIQPPPKNHEGASKIDRFDSVELAGFGIGSPNPPGLRSHDS